MPRVMKTLANAVREGTEASRGGQLGESWIEAMGRFPDEAANNLFELNGARLLEQVAKQKWG